MKDITCVTLWVEGDIPENCDWDSYLPEGVKLTENDDNYSNSYTAKTFPWENTYHEIKWWILRPLNMDEWIALDDAESEVLGKILGDDFMGTAGPIPFDKDGKTYPELIAEMEANES